MVRPRVDVIEVGRWNFGAKYQQQTHNGHILPASLPENCLILTNQGAKHVRYKKENVFMELFVCNGFPSAHGS